MEYLLPYLCMVTVPHIVVGLERMLDYRGVGLARFHCSRLEVSSTCRVTVDLVSNNHSMLYTSHCTVHMDCATFIRCMRRMHT